MADLIHLAGADCSGKSTLANALVKELGWSTKHFIQPKDMLDGKQQYFNFIRDIQENTILDRFHCGEFTYAPILRGYTGDYLHEFELELVRQGHNYMLVHVKAEFDEVIRRARTRGEDFLKEEYFQTVLDAFENFTLEQQMPWIEVDTTNTKTEDNIRKIIEAKDKVFSIWNQLRGCTLGCTRIFDPTYPRGNVNADYFIIGQNPGGQDKRSHGVAFGDGPTATFLTKVLKEAGILHNSWITNLVLCPSYDNKIKRGYAVNCSPHLKLQLGLIQPKKIFVLGSDTAKYLDQGVYKDFDVVQLKHPQYVQRFRRGEIDQYIETFKREML